MAILKILIMALVQAVTEFMPVSSRGHYILLRELLNYKEPGVLFDLFLHFGAFIVICLVYHKDLLGIILEGGKFLWINIRNFFCFFAQKVLKKSVTYDQLESNRFQKLAISLMISFIPFCIAGFIFRKKVDVWDQNLLYSGIGMLATALFLFSSDFKKKGKKNLKMMTYKDALIIGIFQACSIFPGCSRLGMCLVGAKLVGMEKSTSIKYSFLLYLPSWFVATLYKCIVKDYSSFSVSVSEAFIGFIGSVVLSFFAHKMVSVYLRDKKYKYFALYSAAAGVLSVVCHFVFV